MNLIEILSRYTNFMIFSSFDENVYIYFANLALLYFPLIFLFYTYVYWKKELELRKYVLKINYRILFLWYLCKYALPRSIFPSIVLVIIFPMLCHLLNIDIPDKFVVFEYDDLMIFITDFIR